MSYQFPSYQGRQGEPAATYYKCRSPTDRLVNQA